MGKYNGKVLTVYITPSGARVAEGENKNGSPYISRFFVVNGIEEFFTEIPGEVGRYEVTNMTELVETLVSAFKSNHTGSHRIMVCSNCFNITTSLSDEEGTGSLKELLAGDVIANIKKRREAKPKAKASPDKMYCNITWGSLVEDGVVQRKITETVGDKFMLKSMVQEFYRRGYEVISVSDSVGTLINFRHTEEATFDSQGKIIFDFDTQVHVISMKKDLPVAIDSYRPMTNDEILERVDNLVTSCIDNVGRNPKIFFTGMQMQDTLLYSALIDRLESLGYIVYDMFDRPDVDPISGNSSLNEVPVITADYSANIALFMNAYAKNVVSIVPSVEMGEVFRRNAKAIAVVFLLLSLGAVGTAGFFAFTRFQEMQAIQGKPLQVASLESQITSLESNKSSLESTIETLTQADVTVLDLMNFVRDNQSPLVSVVSVDTMDMLPLSTSVMDSSTQVTVSTDLVTGDNSANTAENGPIVATNINREPIIIRGYARTDAAAISYFDKMFHCGLPVDPVLNGIEKYSLPNGDEVYIFEIRVGGGAS